MQRQTRKTKAPWAVLLALFLLATAMFPTAAWASAQQDPSASEEVTYLDTVSVSPDADLEEGNVEILYYFYNRCLSCDEEATIEENILGMLKKDFPNVTADLTIKNVAEEENLEALRQALIDSGVGEEKLMQHPIVFIGDQVLIGSQELGEKFQPAVAAYLEEQRAAEDESVTIQYLYAEGCSECEQVTEFLDGITAVEVQNEDGSVEEKPLRVERIDAGNIADIEEINALYSEHQVKPEERRVPIVLYDGGYFVGYENIQKNLINALKNGNLSYNDQDLTEEAEESLSAANLFWVALSGLIGGLSPCSMSLVLLLFSLLIADKQKVLKAGFGFILGRIILYFLLGTVFFGLLQAIDRSLFSGINTVVAILVVVIGCLFAVLSFIDFLRTKNGRAGKAILQFTPRMKAFYRRTVEKLSTGKAVFIAAMLAGAVIAVGEFLCTGQLFAATVLYYFDASAGNMMVGALIFLLYTVMLSLPAVVVTLLIYKGKQYLDIAAKFAGKEYLIKLVMAILFLGFAALSAYHLWGS